MSGLLPPAIDCEKDRRVMIRPPQPTIDDGTYRSDAIARSEELLALLIEHHGNDNATGCRADIPAKIQAALDRREQWRRKNAR